MAGAFIGAALLLTAACGSEDGDDSTSAAEDRSGESQADGESNEAAPEENNAPEETAAPAEDGGSATEYCALLEEVGDDVLNGATGTGADGGAALTGMVRDVAAVAPSDIAADWTTLADVYETMSDIDYSDPDAAAELEQFGDLEQVGQRIQQHVQSECA